LLEKVLSSLKDRNQASIGDRYCMSPRSIVEFSTSIPQVRNSLSRTGAELLLPVQTGVKSVF
jgi:hypothetical protein